MSERKVIIRGHVFDYEEKAPFVASGKSVLGALEYDPNCDFLRCHECGEWFESVGGHLKVHEISGREYKLRHGLNVLTTSLNGMRKRSRMSEWAKSRIEQLGAANPLLNFKSPGPGLNASPRTERRNQNGRCRAQILFRIQVLAAELGHTPTRTEMVAAGISDGTLLAEFGSFTKAMEEACLTPNSVRRNPNTPLPPGFPTKRQLWETRMPWPKEYFQTYTKDSAEASYGLSYSPQSTLGGAIYGAGAARKHQSAE